jgi:hypothetical protein
MKDKNKDKKFLNNKKYRNDLDKNNFDDIHNEKEKILNIPGFYYDKEKKRYFPIKYQETINFKNKEKPQFQKNKTENHTISNFNLIRSSKFTDKKILKKQYNRIDNLKISNYINIEYEEDKLPNTIYLFYSNKYLLKLDYFNPSSDNNNNTFTNILIHDVINNIFIKKIVIEEFYDDFIIKDDNLILIDNITKISIINDIKTIIESKDKKIFIKFINKFKIKIDNIERISMVYKWPFININNKYTYYYLVWNNFFYFDISVINNKEKLIVTNGEILYLSKNQLMNNKIIFKINKVKIDKKYHYINFFINRDNNNNSSNFYFFTVNGEIHNYKFKKNNIFKLKQIITNEILNNIQIINIKLFKKEYNYLLVSNKNDIFNLNLKYQTITKININKENNENKNINYKMKIFEYIDNINSLIYDDNEYIRILNLDDFTNIGKLIYNNYKYNILIFNHNNNLMII